MKKIRLHHYFIYALVDDEDYEFLSRYDWWLSKTKTGTLYAKTYINSVKVLMHNLIIPNLLNGLIVDHKDGNGLNNQKENLRPATYAQNGQNRKKSINTSSVYKGVYWSKNIKVWRAYIKVNGESKHLGYYKSEVMAAKVYNRAAKKYFGEFAKLNVLPIIKVS